MLTIGLTGGIGCGKTTVSNLFAELGAAIIDADLIAREVVAPNTQALKEILQHFGPTIINADNTLNRQQLRQIIFHDPQQKYWLEQLLHPLIRSSLKQQMAAVQSSYCILVIPLLLENNRAIPVDRVLVIDALPAVQIQRIQKRDNISTSDAENILRHQLSREQRLAAADDIITNNGTHIDDSLRQRVTTLHHFYQTLAAE